MTITEFVFKIINMFVMRMTNIIDDNKVRWLFGIKISTENLPKIFSQQEFGEISN